MRRWLTLLLLIGWVTLASLAGQTDEFSHDEWGRVLDRFVDDRGLVDYRGLAADRVLLDGYLARIERTSPRSEPAAFPSRDHELAYWINAYNALVFHGVLARGPEDESVWTGGLVSGYAFFVGQKVTLGGGKTNLRKLENKIIRAQYDDPRIHAALNCASIGCPRLPRKPLEPATLDAQLDAAMREFVSEQRNVDPSDSARTVELSKKIFDWFREDFLGYENQQGSSSATLLDYVNRYRSADAQVPADYRVTFKPYDKRINKQP